jgi:glucose-6-phosphate isomerase
MKLFNTPTYTALLSHHEELKTYSLRRFFEENNSRAEQFSAELDGMYFDYSKNHLSAKTIELLCGLANERGLPKAIHDLLSGAHVNNTENRPALHTALRHQGGCTTNEQQAAIDTRQQMKRYVDRIHANEWLGYTKKPITTVVNIGIGGSDLGPRMVTQALSDHNTWTGEVQFVANIDGADISDTLRTLAPETTLFISASKSFTTSETLANTLAAKQWLLDGGCKENELEYHFIAITTNISAAKDIGVSEDNILPIWDWVGGRYSLWSAIGLPIAISIGMDNFEELLAGANAMDEHYKTTELSRNMPIIAAFCSFWYSQFWDAKSHVILPYAQRLSRLPAYLQQLDMESLGKSVTKDGEAINYPTGSIIWGTEGSNGQHSFHQLLHQGTHVIPTDFILVNQPMSSLTQQHRELLACGISQSQALLQGKTLKDATKELQEQGMNKEEIEHLAPHKVVAGNKPSSTIVLDSLNPKNVGTLIAFYEHKVHALGVLLDINPFDQWGVELGKQLAKPIAEALQKNAINAKWDSSTKSLIEKLM